MINNIFKEFIIKITIKFKFLINNFFLNLVCMLKFITRRVNLRELHIIIINIINSLKFK